MHKLPASLRHMPGVIPGPHRIRAPLDSARDLYLTLVPLASARRIGELFAGQRSQLHSKVAVRTLPQAQDHSLREEIQRGRVIELNAAPQPSCTVKQRNRGFYR